MRTITKDPAVFGSEFGGAALGGKCAPVANSATGTTGAVTATLPAAAGRTTFIRSFHVGALGTSRAAVTIGGLAAGTLTFEAGHTRMPDPGHQVTEPRRLATVRDYAELHLALRARAEELALSRTTLDEIAGLTPGHSSKLLAPRPIKFLGRVSLGPLPVWCLCSSKTPRRSSATPRKSALPRMSEIPTASTAGG